MAPGCGLPSPPRVDRPPRRLTSPWADPCNLRRWWRPQPDKFRTAIEFRNGTLARWSVVGGRQRTVDGPLAHGQRTLNGRSSVAQRRHWGGLSFRFDVPRSSTAVVTAMAQDWRRLQTAG